MPLTPPPSVVHTSPGTYSPVTMTHLLAFQATPPPSAHAVHFSPGSQSCLNTSHSIVPVLPPSGIMMKAAVVPVSVALGSVVVVGLPVVGLVV